MSIIEVKNLTKYYKEGKDDVEVIKKLTFNINKGEFTTIIGPSGSGKSTLLYLLSGMEPMTSGEVILLNEKLNNITEKRKGEMRRKEIGFVFQFYNLISEMTVEDNIVLNNLIGKDKIDKERIKTLLELVGLTGYEKRFPTELSGGQQQRVAIARALYNKPEIIFMDEPTGNLDSKTGDEIMELFVKINKDYNTTIVQVTHSMKHAQLSDRIINLVDGEIIDDTKKEK